MRTNPEVKEEIEEVLARQYPPGWRFPESKLPIEIEVTEIDISNGKATIRLGNCLFEEGSRFGMLIKSFLERKIPELTQISILIHEID